MTQPFQKKKKLLISFVDFGAKRQMKTVNLKTTPVQKINDSTQNSMNVSRVTSCIYQLTSGVCTR